MEMEQKKTAGRPRKHKNEAARVAAFRARARYPGHRCDVYLGEEAYLILIRLKKQSSLSTSGVVEAILTGQLKPPVTK